MPSHSSSLLDSTSEGSDTQKPLRLVFAHNRYRNRGGEDESRDQEISLLRSKGHEVFEYEVDNKDISRSSYLAAGFQSIWNMEQQSRLTKFMQQTRPHILKVDNYFPILSPSVFSAAKGLGIATVLSVRNYRMICPGASLFRDGHICTDCVGSKLALSAIRHQCYRGSYLQSAAVALSNGFAHFFGTWEHSVDRYIAVSEFVKKELIRGGFPSDKISVKANSIVDTGVGSGDGGYALFVGRLIPEKGIRTLLDAWQKLGTSLPLKIIGEGSLEDLVIAASKANSNIEYLKRQPIAKVCEYMGRATFLVFPSEWFEPFGRSIVEAYSKGTPVIGADTEPMRDMIESGQTGMFFQAGDSDDLARTILSMVEDKQRLSSMREQARLRYLKSYSAEENYTQIMTIFGHALSTQ
jgi:glycosyltransferase involved in cell wall biosynthesis